MTIQANYPTIRPSLMLDFANTERLDPRLTFTRSSTGTYIDGAGVLRTAASGVPRFTHDAATGESLGLMVEQQSVNLCLYSEDLAGSGWNTSATSVSADAAVAPDGLTTADLVTATSGTSSARFRSVTFTGDGEKSLSVYVKQGTATRNQLFLFDSTASLAKHYVRMTWTAGVPTVATVAGSGSIFPVVSMGNGWYRIQISVASVVAANSHIFGIQPDDLAGTGSVYAWGFQAENLNVPTSYVQTVAGTVTRNADACVMTGANFWAWYRADEGTLVAEARPVAQDTIIPGPVLATLVGGSVNDFIEIARSSSTGTMAQAIASINTGGSLQTNFSSFGSNVFLAQGPRGRVAFAYRANDCRAAANGTLSTLDTTVTLPAITQLSIGARTAGASRWFNGPVARVAYYPLRLTDAQLQAVSL